MASWGANWQALAALAVILFLALWVANRQRFAFLVVLRNGAVRVRQGKVAGPFLDQIRTVCQEQSIQNGWIGGVRLGGRIRLVFSPSVPPACQQQMRNIWTQIGWTTTGLANRQRGKH